MKKLLAAGLALLALAPASAAFARPITATDLATMRRIAAPAVSPDGNWAVYQLRETDLEGNRGRTDLWLLDLRRAGAEPVRIASSPQHNEHDPRFSPDGRWIYYLSNASGSDQLWRVAPAGRNAGEGHRSRHRHRRLPARPDRRPDRALDRSRHALRRFQLHQQCRRRRPGAGRQRAGSMTKPSCATGTPGRRRATRSRIFTFPMADGRPQGAGTPVAPNLAGDSPSKPFGGAEELAWSADGRTLYFTLREGGRTEPNSTNLDIYAAREGEAPVNLTAANRGMDTGPAVSPDGRWLAYTAMARPTYEADRQVVQLRNLQTGETRALTQAWDRSVGSIAWAPDGRAC